MNGAADRQGNVSLEALPLMLTVDEAAAVCRISRSAAYELTRIYRETGGQSGLPVIRLGRALRVPRHALLTMLGAAIA